MLGDAIRADKTMRTDKRTKTENGMGTRSATRVAKTTRPDRRAKTENGMGTRRATRIGRTMGPDKAIKTARTIGREEIIETLVRALEPLDYVYAIWEGGAIGFGRLDEWSDIDLYVDAQDERIQEVFPVVEQTLESLSPIELKYDVIATPSQGYLQVFYRLRDTTEFLLIDLAVIKHYTEEKFLEPEMHGQAFFYFNKNNAIKCPSLDKQKLVEDSKTRLERIKKRFETFRCFIRKEINRKNYIEALDLYRGLMLDSLVEVLRIKYKPVHHAFKTRYIHYHLPADIVSRLEDLYFVKNQRDLENKYHIAEQWFYQAVSEIDFEAIAQRLGIASKH
jgi:hypothetical protein